jgi:hypothetical protein
MSWITIHGTHNELERYHVSNTDGVIVGQCYYVSYQLNYGLQKLRYHNTAEIKLWRNDISWVMAKTVAFSIHQMVLYDITHKRPQWTTKNNSYEAQHCGNRVWVSSRSLVRSFITNLSTYYLSRKRISAYIYTHYLHVQNKIKNFRSKCKKREWKIDREQKKI